MDFRIVPYDPDWPAAFAAIGSTLRAELGDAAVRIDHIGSTAVPGLAASMTSRHRKAATNTSLRGFTSSAVISLSDRTSDR
jgi:hypothetical protein